MIGFRSPRILQTAALVAGMLLAVGFCRGKCFQPPQPASCWRRPPRSPIPLLVVAAGSGARPDETSDLVWLVQRGAASGEQRTELAAFPLGFVLAERGTLVVFDANGTHITELGPGQAILLPVGTRGSFGSANGDLVLYVQIALVPVTVVPDTLPRGTLVSKSFRLPAGIPLASSSCEASSIQLALRRCRPAQCRAVASDRQRDPTRDGYRRIDLPSGELFLLAEPATCAQSRSSAGDVRDRTECARGARNATPVEQAGLDPVLDDAWHRYGCHLNPGNPSCLTVGLATGCTIDATGPGCSGDSDGDRCTDVAEAEMGFDPFDSADCISSAGGAARGQLPLSDRESGLQRRPHRRARGERVRRGTGDPATP